MVVQLVFPFDFHITIPFWVTSLEGMRDRSDASLTKGLWLKGLLAMHASYGLECTNVSLEDLVKG